MANIEDYIKWRGDLSFLNDSFNEVDSLILTQLCYLHLDGIVPPWNEKRSISMPKLIESYWLKNSPAEIEKKLGIEQKPAKLLGLLKKSRRFSELHFANYVNLVDKEKQEQFSAMTVWIPDGTIYVAYSGTDNTIVGWRENFNMTYMNQVPAQKEAANYLERIYEWSNFKIRMGGHSKGGNLAVYAAIHANNEITDKIIAIDNFDGPGFRQKVAKHPDYIRTMEKVRTYLPETAIVGRFLEHTEVYSVVKSDAKGAWQHDAFSWQVEGNSFLFKKKLDAESNMVETTVNLWLDKMSNEERAQFVDTLFHLLEQAQIETVNDFSSMKLRDIFELLKLMTDLDEKRRKDLRRVLRILWKEAADVIGKEMGLPEKPEPISLPIFGKKKEEEA